MKKIQCSGKYKNSIPKFAIIDDNDFELVSRYNWTFSGGYVYTSSANPKMLLHRFILGLSRFDKKEVDHINRNCLDNRKINLRVCDKSENGMNRPAQKNNKSSGFKGVSWHKSTGKYQARISFRKKAIWLGEFDDKFKAAAAYNLAAEKYHGIFACLNVL